jgi:hypothetical protein
MSRHKVPNKKKNAHDDVLCNGSNVGTRNLQDLDFVVDGSVKINVVGANSSGDAKFEIFGLQTLSE